MAERTAKAAGGNFMAATTWEPEGVPVAGDDLFLKATSGNVTINAAAVCRSLNCTGYTGILKHEAFSLVVGTSTAPPENKAIIFSAGMTYTTVAGAKISMGHTVAATTVTVDFAGKTLLGFELSAAVSAASGTKLSSDLISTGIITFSKGIFETNNKEVTASSFQATAANTKILRLGSSTVNITSNGGTWNWNAAGAGTIVEAGTSTIKMTAAQFSFGGGEGMTYNKVEFLPVGSSGNFSIPQQNMTINELIIKSSGAGPNDYRIAPNFTVGKLVVQNATSETLRDGIRVLISSADSAGNATPGTKTKITATTTELENCDFMDIEAKGAASWAGTRIGDCLGNSGITFDAPKTCYAVVAGNTSAKATWGETSGGAGGKAVPLPQDTAIFDSASAATTYTLNSPRLCKDLEMTGFTRTLTVSIATNIFGSQTFSSGMTLSGGQGITYRGRGSHTIKTAGKPPVQATIIAPGGTYTLGETFVCGNVFHNYGAFATNNFNLELTGRYEHSGTGEAELIPGSSVFIFTTANFWVTTTAGLTIAPNTAVVKCAVAEPELRSGGYNFNGMSFEITGTGTLKNSVGGGFTGVKTFKRTNAAACAIQFGSTFTYAAENWEISGTAGNLVTITAATAGSAFIIKKTSGTGVVSQDYISLKDSKAEGGATFYAGAHSTNVSGNSGWLFEAAPTLTTISLIPATSTNTAQARAAKKIGSATPAAETDAARIAVVFKRPLITPAVEADAAQARGAKKLAKATPATEVDSALARPAKKLRTLSAALEATSALSRAIRRLVGVTPAEETTTAQHVHVSVVVFVELPSALTVGANPTTLAVGASPTELSISNEGRTTALTIEYGPVKLSIQKRADKLTAGQATSHLTGQGEGNT